ncbi:MAG: polysaccharide biosynthesis protein, partial [Clostridia bacterium]|nr:polysaccharide biosynthesis protein [Clostridia bacterium]
MKARTVKQKPKLISRRKFVLFLFDFFCFFCVDAAYYLLSYRASYGTPVDDFSIYLYNSLILGALIFAARFILNVYANVWRYTRTLAFIELVAADCIGAVLTIIIARISGVLYIGIWHAITVAALTALVALSSRFCYRMVYKNMNRESDEKSKIRVAIIGAGQLGAFLASELRDNPNSQYDPLFFVDRDKNKIGQRVAGLPVFGEDEVADLSDKYFVDEFIIAITGITNNTASEVYERYASMGRKIKIYDSPIREGDEAGENKKRVVRDFSIEDLLFRQELNVESDASRDYYKGKTVLVTGGGGSIGSEICRQIAKCGPKKLIILDIYENNAYDIQQELIRKYGKELDLAVEIASVRDRQRLDSVFNTYRPDVVFHAAAHKHVPLMEHSACEAVKNNVIGTYNTADMAEKYGAAKFIMISTDKAVNPTNVMGASKRVCEMIVQCRKNSTTSFAAVRFGNVLGSNGSV